jgi:hypothetical protein
MIRTVYIYLAGAITILLSIGFCAGRASAHDGYGKWERPDLPGASCCNEHDCRPVRAAQDMDGNWTAYPDGRPVRVPRRNLLKIPSPDGRSHWCGSGVTTFCFVAGEVRG